MNKALLPIALLISFCIGLSTSCGNSVQAPSGDLPTWKAGDTWTIKSTLKWPYENESTSISVYSVTGEQVYNGIDCYIVNRQVTTQGTSTTPESEDTMTQAFDKTTLRVIGFESSANSSWYAWGGSTNCSTIAEYISINYSVKPYPLSIGKAWTAIENETMTCLLPIPIGVTPIPTRNSSLIYKVEGIESITVPAGTFNCFKIVIYSSENEPLETEWVTDVTRGFPVKRISNQIDYTVELTSYSLSE
jgi:hypothetical protein